MCKESRHLALSLLLVLSCSVTISAQTPDQDPHAGHQMASAETPMNRAGSGTSWLPDNSPMRAIHAKVDGWAMMTHFNLFAQYVRETGSRGSSQGGSINWFMTEARRSTARGSFAIRGMISAEPFTIGGCGYPDLLATGESCEGEAIHDRQHPHDLLMEVAALYETPLGHGMNVQLYGGPVGEPALGPVAFMHRPSGAANLLAPITHHWFDATHITYGVATAAVYGSRWKIESSVFNGREPDEVRTDLDLAAMDSWSARAWWLPSSRWALQVSTGFLNDVEPGHDDERIDARRTTASAMYQRSLRGSLSSATTLAWGRNAEIGEQPTDAWLIETTLANGDRNAIYARAEVVKKSAHDLSLSGDELFTVAKLQAGYTQYFARFKYGLVGLGAAASVGIVPESLVPSYGRRAVPGFNVHLAVIPRS